MPDRAERTFRRTAAERKPREERWAELIEVATQVFYEKGYEKASLQEIADRVGMLKGSLYYYIQSKEDLLYEVVSTVHERGLSIVRQLAERSGEPLERLENVIHGHVVHTCRTLIPTTVFLHELSSLPEERRAEVLGGGHTYQSVFRGLVEEARERGQVREDVDPKLAALFILGSTNWLYRWFKPDGPYSPERIATDFADMAVRGIASEAGLAARERWRTAATAQG
ncbi:MAG: TetR/AcrR family transcriptional regulator [Thermocrispum agreste]